MNRHYQDYAALPSEVLGTPIRHEPAKPSPETPWKAVQGHPDYLERTTAQGVKEVTHKDHVPAPAKASALVEQPAADVPAAPTEWQSGAPPARGWWPSTCYAEDSDVNMASFWNGVRWTHYTQIPFGSVDVHCRDDGWTRFWQGDPLVGSKWPEPQA
jgi:hypothetical protein